MHGRRIALLALVFAVMATGAWAAGGTEGSTQAASGGKGVEITFPLVKEPLTLTLFWRLNPKATATLKDYPEMSFFKEMARKTGITMKFQHPKLSMKGVWGFIIREDWVAKLGLKVPETVDEWYAVLTAFRQKDPNGNGKTRAYAALSHSPRRKDAWIVCASRRRAWAARSLGLDTYVATSWWRAGSRAKSPGIGARSGRLGAAPNVRDRAKTMCR